MIASFLVNHILSDPKNNAHIVWLTKGKAAYRFMTAKRREGWFFQ